MPKEADDCHGKCLRKLNKALCNLSDDALRFLLARSEVMDNGFSPLPKPADNHEAANDSPRKSDSTYIMRVYMCYCSTIFGE